HDYFIAKTLDKVRPGGVIAFITSSGTLDKANPSVRKYISQRAELMGAVRLPNNAFKSYAGTEVTSDIIFLRKREKMIDIAPDWVYTSKNPDGLTINNYFIENPEMILGKVVEGNKLYGKGTMVVPFENSDLKVILNEAVKKIKGNYTAEKSVIAKPSGKKKDKFKPEILPADPTVKNFSYAEIDGKIFYRENSIMTEMPFTGKRYERVSGIAAISKCVRELLNMQLE
uniref:N-6 DNA methylase n=1 Tax=Porcipelethomonas ammoniilytica TaxID=2981722 RepID=UPI000A468DE6